MFDSEKFSRDLKIQKAKYQSSETVDENLLSNYIKELKDVDLNKLTSDSSKIAFWINVYNGMTNYVIIQMKIKESMKEVEGIFKKKIFTIGATTFSLDDIEHGILRRNKRDVFEKNDFKQSLIVEKLDYRIHFALNCGANSCPLIAYYSSENLDNELAIAEAVFVGNEFFINSETQEITCSPLFDWYREDFENKFLDNPQFKDYQVLFKEYDWSI